MGWIDSVKPLRVGQQAAGALGGQIELSGGSRGSGAKEHGDALAGSKGKGLDGLVAEPAGSPAMVSWTLAEKPFWALMEMLTSELVPPCETVKDVAESAMEKSGEGGVVGTPPVPPPPPQAAAKLTMETKKS
jgi:hypothetical protein